MRALTLCVLVAGAGLAACGDDGERLAAKSLPKKPAAAPAGTVLKITAKKSGSGAYEYFEKKLEAKAGTIAIEFDNADTFPHNVRIQTGKKCCFKPRQKDVGGTNTISGGQKTRATVKLAPGTYRFLCSIGGHWNGSSGKMRGVLVVR